nr:hypothetical protein Iba_chr02bCG23800 [Ipomoea batatas]
MATKNGRSVASICAWRYVQIFNAKKIFRPAPALSETTVHIQLRSISGDSVRVELWTLSPVAPRNPTPCSGPFPARFSTPKIFRPLRRETAVKSKEFTDSLPNHRE